MLRNGEGRRVLVVVVLLLGQAGAYYTISAKETVPEVAPWSEFPATVSDWKAVADTRLEPEVLAALQPDDYLNRDYASGKDRFLNLFVGYFSSRRDGRAPHSPEWCLPGAGWKSVSKRLVHLPVQGASSPLTANEYIVDKGPERAVVLYWYHQGESAMASELFAQLYAVPDMLFHRRTDTSLVRIIVPVAGVPVDGDKLEAARNAGFRFASDVFPLIRRQIR